jgi:hypothetical protein
MGYSGARGTLIYEKNLKAKISCQTPFKPRQDDQHLFGTNRQEKVYVVTVYGETFAWLAGLVLYRGLCFGVYVILAMLHW